MTTKPACRPYRGSLARQRRRRSCTVTSCTEPGYPGPLTSRLCRRVVSALGAHHGTAMSSTAEAEAGDQRQRPDCDAGSQQCPGRELRPTTTGRPSPVAPDVVVQPDVGRSRDAEQVEGDRSAEAVLTDPCFSGHGPRRENQGMEGRQAALHRCCDRLLAATVAELRRTRHAQRRHHRRSGCEQEHGRHDRHANDRSLAPTGADHAIDPQK